MNTKDKLEYWNSLHRGSTASLTKTFQPPLLHYRAKSKLAKWIDKHPRAFFLLCSLLALVVVRFA